MALGNLAHQTQLDIAIGDASGAVALVLGGKQIFIRKDIGSSVTCLAIQSRPSMIVQLLNYFFSSSTGAFNPYLK